MATNPKPAKRARKDASPGSALESGSHCPVYTLSQPTTTPTQQQHRRAEGTPAQPPSEPQPAPDMPMSFHEALEILDPAERTPHDLYAILAYSAVAHPDVGQMLDKFARSHRKSFFGQGRGVRERPDTASSANVSAGPMNVLSRFVPIDHALEGRRRHAGMSPAEAQAQALMYKSSKEAAERAAVRRAERAAKAAISKKRRIKGTTSSVVKPSQDKSFTHLVLKAQEELGWTGRYGQEKYTKANHSPHASELRKDVSFWQNKAVDVRNNLAWMQKQLIKEIHLKNATLRTKINATAASRQILTAVVVDESKIGKEIRECGLDTLTSNFQEAIAALTRAELGKLRRADNGKWIRDLKRLIRLLRDLELDDTAFKAILLQVVPHAYDFEDESESTEGSPGSEDDDVFDEEEDLGDASEDESDEENTEEESSESGDAESEENE